MINFDDYVNENKTEHNRNWPDIPDHPYRILIIGGSASGSALSSGKIHKYQYLTGEDILPSNQQQITEQARFTIPPQGKLSKNKQKQLKIRAKTDRGFEYFKI